VTTEFMVHSGLVFIKAYIMYYTFIKLPVQSFQAYLLSSMLEQWFLDDACEMSKSA